MEKGTISQINESIQRFVGNKFRRSLKEVQLSADNERLVGSNMICPNDKTLLKVKQPKTVEKVIKAEKENVPTVRRSKRKTAVDKVTYVESPENVKPSKPKTQTKKTATKSKKSRSVAAKKNEQENTLNQSKINFPTVTTDTVKENACASQPDSNVEKRTSTASTKIDEDSGFDPTCGISGQSPMNSTAISRSSDIKSSSVLPYNMISAITAESPPLNYWRDLAEQRRIALENALHENELLHDQLAVLEAENTQLKHLLKEAENVVQVVRAIINN